MVGQPTTSSTTALELEGVPGTQDPDGVDRSLVRWMLRLTPTERLAYAQGMIELVASVRPTRDGNR